MKAVVAAFNQEKALVGAFTVITNLRMELFEALIRIKMMLPLLQPLNVLQEYRRCDGDGRDVHHHRPGVRGRHHRGLSQEEQTPERGESLACQVINCHSSDHLLNHSTSVTLHTLHRNKYNCVTRLIKRG